MVRWCILVAQSLFLALALCPALAQGQPSGNMQPVPNNSVLTQGSGVSSPAGQGYGQSANQPHVDLPATAKNWPAPYHQPYEEMVPYDDWSPEQWMSDLGLDHCRLFASSANAPRYVGYGKPLQGTSWLNRPISLGIFGGSLVGDEVIRGTTNLGGSFFGGFRAGLDIDYYWGVETRLGWAQLPISSPTGSTNGNLFLADLSLLYYPWGDAKWRPYFLAGIGFTDLEFADPTVGTNQALLMFPLGVGLKYQYNPWLIVRAEYADNIAVGSGQINSMHNLAFNLGFEFRLGGRRRSFYPWHPSRHIW